MAYATAATRLAEVNADEYASAKKEQAGKGRQIGKQRQPQHDRHRSQTSR